MYAAPFVRNPYNYDPDLVSRETGLDCSDSPSMTKQSFKAEADINTIVRNFGLTGELPGGIRAPQYGDFTGITDYRSALHAVMAAEESFNSLSANVRERFHNDPAAFVDFCSNPANAEEMVKLGLASFRASALEDAVSPSSLSTGVVPAGNDAGGKPT